MKKALIKNIFSLALAFVVFVSGITVSDICHAEDRINLIFCEDFEKYNVGAENLPGYGGSAKKNVWKVVSNGSNKMYKMSVCSSSDMHLDKTLKETISGKFILQFTCIFEDGNNVNRQFQFMDSDNKDIPILLFAAGGKILTYDGKAVGNYSANTEHRFSVAADTESSQIKVYIDGEYKGTYNRTIKDVQKWRFHINRIADSTSLYIDNIRIYSGNRLLNDAEFDALVKTSPENIEFLMKDAVAMYLNKSNVLLHGKKAYISQNKLIAPIEKNESVMIPADYFAESIGAEYSYDGITAKISGSDATYSVKPGKEYYKTNNDTKRASEKAFLKNDKIFVPINDACRVFGKYLHIESNGLIIYSDTDMEKIFDWTGNGKIMRKIEESFIYDDVSGDEILSAIKANYPNNQHPRLILTNAKFQEIRNEVYSSDGDSVYKKIFERLKNYADSFLGVSPAVYELRDGKRLLPVCRECSDRMLSCAIIYNITGEEKYAVRAYREMEAAANFKDWNPYHFLDVGEMASCMGFAYDWLYNWMDESQRELIRNAIVSKAIYPLMDDFDCKVRSRSWDWRGELADNWRFVVSGVGCSGLAFVDELSGQELINAERAITQTLIDIRESLSLFAPQGAYEEGVSYWAYSMKYLSFYIEALNSSLGNDFGYADVPGMKLTNDYIFAVNGPRKTFNYHDAGPNSNYYPPQMLFTAKYFNKTNQASKRIKKIMEGSIGCDDSVCDMLLYDISLAGAQEDELPLDYYLPVSELATMRSGYEADDMYVGFHCDNPMGDGGGHDHMDVGHFVLDDMGENFFLDLGSESYNIEGYSQCYRLRAEGHNTIVLNPDADYGQKYGGTARITRHEFSEEQSFAIGDLTKAYDENDGVLRMQRGIKLDRHSSCVTVQDEVRLSEPADFWWFAHTDAETEISSDKKTAILTKNGKKLRASIVSGQGAQFSVMDAAGLPASPKVPSQSPNTGIQKLAIHIENCKNLDLSVVFTKNNAPAAYDDSFIPLSKWSCKGGDRFDSGLLDFENVKSVDSLQSYMTSTGLIGMENSHSAFENANSGIQGGSTITPFEAESGYGNSVLLTRKSQNSALRMYFSYNSAYPGAVMSPVTTKFSLKKCDINSSSFVYEMRMKGGRSEYICRFNSDGGVYFLNNRVCGYISDNWYDIKVSFSPETKYGILKIKKADEASWNVFSGYLGDESYTSEGCERIQFGYTNGGNSSVYIDNLHCFTDESIMSDDEGFFCADTINVLSGKTENILLDDEISFVYTDRIDKGMTADSIDIALKKNDIIAEKEKYDVSIENNTVRVKLNNPDKAALYFLTLSGVTSENGYAAAPAEISFSTADFSVKSTTPQISADGIISTVVETAYNSGKTIYLGAAAYDECGALKNVELAEKHVSGARETRVEFKPSFNPVSENVKVFVFENLKTLTPVLIR